MAILKGRLIFNRQKLIRNISKCLVEQNQPALFWENKDVGGNLSFVCLLHSSTLGQIGLGYIEYCIGNRSKMLLGI